MRVIALFRGQTSADQNLMADLQRSILTTGAKIRQYFLFQMIMAAVSGNTMSLLVKNAVSTGKI